MRLTILKGLTHKVFLICLLLTSFQLSNAQLEGFKARAFMEQDGLAQNTVHVVMQDSKGFIWLGMRTGGLDRFDGYNFVRHRYNPYDSCSISGNEVASIMECSEGYIWVGTRERGLNKYDPRTNKFKVYNFSKDDTTTLPAQNIYALVEDKIGQIWVGTSWGLCVYNRKTDNFLRLFKKKGNKNSYYRGISDIILADDKRVLVATNENGLFMIDCESKEIVKNWKHDPNDPRSLNSVKLAKMLKDKDGQLWCGTPRNGLNRLKNLDSNEFDHFVHDPQNKSTIGPKDVRGIMQDSKGNIWVSGPSGISIIPSTETQNQVPTFKRYTESPYDVNSLSQNALYTVCEDRDGDFWTGTWSNGVNFIKTQSVNFKNYQYIKNNKRSTNLPYVRNIHQHKNKLYVAVQGGGMNVLNLHTGIYKYYTQDYKNPEKSICSHSAEYFLQLDDGNIAVGTNGGLNYFNIERESFSLNLEGNIVRDLEMDKDSNLWVASQKGLYILDTNEKGLNPLKYKDEDYRSIANTARVLFKDSKDRMWVGASYGLKMYRDTAQLDHQFIYEKNDESSISANFINTIAEDKDNNIWVGTSDGLNLYREDSVDFIRYGEWDGLPINEIHNVFSDDNGLIWISTIKGLTSFRYNKDAKTKAESLSDFTTYTVDDGLQGNSFTTNCVFKADDGNIYMGGMNGFNSFIPEKMVINNIKPKVAFTGFKLFNKAVGIGTKDSPLSQDIAYIDELELNHKQGSFTIEYSALNYTASQKCNYKYRMDGHEEEWNEVGTRREANYSNLRAGDYTFMVKASNNDGLWSDQPTTLKVIIKPAWWNTWWFRLLVVLLISAIIYYVIKRRTQEAKERRKELEEKVREATAESERKNAELADAQVKLSGVIEDVKLKLGKTSTKLLEATNSQASSIEEVSASIDQMVNEINENATGTAKMFDNAQVVENNSAESVNIFSKAVGSIEDVAKGIQSITEFARTTNLLSLNAAIEAAKAGEHGRSFGVVANEVKKLADSSQEVAVEIKKLSNNGLDLSHEANEKIVALQGYIKDIVGLISQIRSSTQSQSYEASNVNTAIQQISNYVSDTANLAEQLDEAIKSLSLEE